MAGYYIAINNDTNITGCIIGIIGIIVLWDFEIAGCKDCSAQIPFTNLPPSKSFVQIPNENKILTSRTQEERVISVPKTNGSHSLPVPWQLKGLKEQRNICTDRIVHCAS